MSDRSPFSNLPSGCDPLGFDTDIIPDEFTFCSVPEVCSLPLIPMTFNVMVPDLVISPFCPCFPTLPFSGTGAVALTLQAPELHLTLMNINADCCMPQFSVAVSFEIPCLPLGVESTNITGAVVQDLATPYFVASDPLYKVDDTCALGLDLDLKIPCLPLGLVVSEPELVPVAGEDLFVFTGTITDDCTLKIAVNYAYAGKSDCIAFVSDVQWDSPNLNKYFRNICFTKGRLYTMHAQSGPVIILTAEACP